MTHSVHPTPDQLADLQADLLSDTELDQVQAHVADCADCADELAALEEVQSVLADLGSETLTMPDVVAAELDQVIATASRERAAGVSSLDAKRAQNVPRKPRRASWVLLAGAAAAAVVVIGSIGINGLGGVQSNSDDSGAGGDTVADSGALSGEQERATSPEAGNGTGEFDYSTAPNLTPDTVTAFATKVAAKKPTMTSQQSGSQCARELPRSTSSSAAFADIRWEGQPAVLVVDATAGTLSVFGCGTGAEPLYSTSY